MAPVPSSPMNREISNPPPKDRSLLQHLLRDNEVGAPQQCETAQRFKDQFGDRLGQLGMSGEQVSTLAAAAAKEQTRFAGQGDARLFLLSTDGSTVAMCQAFPPLREIHIGSALAQSERSHWNGAAAMERARTDELAMERGAPSHGRTAQQMDVPVHSRG